MPEAELFFRTDVIWRVPLGYLLQHETDRYTRAAWLVHHPPASDEDEILVLGSSTAAAVAELPDDESQRILQMALTRPELRLVSLTDSGGCYPEHLTLFESAMEQGHHPRIVVLFSFPTCLRQYDDTSALLATRIPLVSSWLANHEESSRPLEVRIRARLVRASAVHRYRHTVNAWLRQRWRGLLLGHAPWEAIVFAGDQRFAAWHGPWDLDRARHARLRDMPGNWSPAGSSARHFGALLALAKRHGVPALVVESPWSPPFFDVLNREADLYHQAMQAIAARYGATYVDPNRSDRLPPELFNDLFHVNHAGARAYLSLLASALSRFTEAS